MHVAGIGDQRGSLGRRGARLATAHRMATLALASGQIIGRGVAILMGAVAAPMS